MTSNWNEKYRPIRIADFWQADNPQIAAVGAMLKAGILPQALILIGYLGVGKTSLARAIGRRFLCTNSPTGAGDSCGSCEGCRSLSGSKRGTICTDGYLEFDASAMSSTQVCSAIYDHVSSNRLTQVPEPMYRKWIICIDEIVHGDAKLQPTLIKIVENVTRARFILSYSDPSRVLPALASRALHVRLTPATTDQATAAVIRIADAEGYLIEESAARFLVDSMRCLPRDCVKTLELAATLAGESKITLETIRAALAMSGSTALAHA